MKSSNDFAAMRWSRLAGYYAGWIASAFMAGRMLTSLPWGAWSDRHGRKPVLTFACASSAILSLAFGFSFRYSWALVVRLLTGAANGSVGAAKTAVAELCPGLQQPKGMAFVSATWALGLITGPAIGGILAEPSSKFAAFASDGMFAQFPYLLPCLVSATVALAGWFACVVWLPETLVPQRPPLVVGRSPTLPEAQPSPARPMRCIESFGLIAGNVFNTVAFALMGARYSASRVAYTRLGDDETAVGSIETQPATDKGPTIASEQPPSAEDEHSVAQQSSHSDASSTEQEFSCDGQQDTNSSGGDLPLWRRKGVQIAIGLYGIYSMEQIAADEVLPLFALAPRSEGGLGMDTTLTGTVFGIIGICVMVYQVFLYPRVARLATPLKLYAYSALALVPLLLLLPYISLLGSQTMVRYYIYICARLEQHVV